MNIGELLTTPLPATGWVLDAGMAVGLRRDRKAGLLCAASPLAEGAVEVGPVGLQKVETTHLVAALRPVQEAIEGGRRPAVLLPSRWSRLHLMELDELPRKRTELDEVVRWRLKKLVPVRPADLRLDLVPFRAGEGRWRVLCLSGLERAWADLEEAFAGVGVQPALLTPVAFALAHAVPGESPAAASVHLEEGMLTVLVWENRQLLLAHTRLLPPGPVPWDLVERELRTVALYVTERLGLEGDLEVIALTGPGLEEEELTRRLGALGDTRVLPVPPAPPCRGVEEGARSALRALSALHGGSFR